MKKEISTRQIAMLISISVLTFKLTYFPSVLFTTAGRDGIVSLILLILADLLSFALVMTIFVKHKNESFSEFLENRIGKFASKIIYLVIFIFFLSKLISLTSAGYYFARESIFLEATLILFIFVLFATINGMFLFKINSYARTLEMCYPIMIFALFVCVMLGLVTTSNYGIFPLFQTNANSIFEAFWNGLFCFGDYIFLLPLMGKVKFDKKFGKRVAFYLCISIGLIIGLSVSFYSMFRYTAFLHQHAITDIVEFVPLSSIIENLDMFPTSLMLMLYIFHGALFLFCLVNTMKEIIKFKHKRYDSRWILLAINVLLLLLIYLFFSSFDFVKYFNQKYITWLNAFTMFVIPVICFGLSFKKAVNKKPKRFSVIKIIDENLKWISEAQTIKKHLALTKKIRFGGQVNEKAA